MYTVNNIYFGILQYVHEVYVLSHFCQVSSVYLTIAATVERWMTLYMPVTSRRFCSGSSTPAFYWIAAMFVFTSSLTVTKYWELSTNFDELCAEFGRYSLGMGPLLHNPVYIQVYTIWLSNGLFVFFPFLVLAVLNTSICIRLRRIPSAKLMPEDLSTTSTLLGSVICCYK